MNFSNMVVTKVSAQHLPTTSKIPNGKLKNIAKNVITLAEHVKDQEKINVNHVVKMVFAVRLLIENPHLENVFVL